MTFLKLSYASVFFAIMAASGALHAQTAGTIKSESHSGLCVDVPRGSHSDGKELVQWSCNGGHNQSFTFVPTNGAYQIRARHSHKCLAVQAASTAQGAKVTQRSCAPDEHMLWQVVGSAADAQIMAQHSGMCLSTQGNSRERGKHIIQSACSGTTSALWRVKAELTDPGIMQSKWDGPYPMPLVPVAAASRPDGKILAWSAYAKMTFVSLIGARGKTYTVLFDPATGQSSKELISDTKHDMFCPGTALLADGRLMVTGGSNSDRTSIYDPVSGLWEIGLPMNISRGYHSMTPLGDGSVFTVGGSWSGGVGGKSGEVWNKHTGWLEKDAVQVSQLITDDKSGTYRADNHKWLFAAPNGLIFHAGPSRRMNWIDLDTYSNGAIYPSLLRDNDQDAMNGNAVMYDIGKIFTVGGAPHYEHADASKRAYVIDINGGVDDVDVKRVGDMKFARVFQNSVVLPSGEIVVVGGQAYSKLFTDYKAVYVAEIWSPTTGEFRSLATMRVPRTYHSVAILLKDGRVWVGGGGLCGGCSTNHPDAEILTPPYLLNADGSLAERPAIISSPAAAAHGEEINIQVDTNKSHSFVLVRNSVATHAVNNDERRIPLIARDTGEGTYSVSIPENPSVAIPGNYYLFALNSKGIPSIAGTIRIEAPLPSEGDDLIVNGSFEYPAVNGSWQYFEGLIPGWRTYANKIDLHKDGFTGVTTSEGKQWLEIDADGGWDRVYQDVQTEPNQRYVLRFDARKRPDQPEQIQVYWRGQPVALVTPPDINGWTQYSYNLVGSGNKDQLEFREVATENDSRGGLIDRVQLIKTETPVPVFYKTEAIGGLGGDPFEQRCNDGQVIVGISGQADWALDRIAPICVNVNARGQWVGQPQTGYFVGSRGGSAFVRQCAKDHAITGIKVWQGYGSDWRSVGRTQVVCRKLTGPTTFTGSTQSLDQVGRAGAYSGQLLCASDKAPLGIHGRYGRLIDQLGLVCY